MKIGTLIVGVGRNILWWGESVLATLGYCMIALFAIFVSVPVIWGMARFVWNFWF